MRRRTRERSRSTGEILRERAPRPRRAAPREAAPAALSPSAAWGRRLLGVLLLLGTVTLVSCQSVFAALSPGLYR
jgi:hypothetical protein